MEGITRLFPALRSRILESPSQCGWPRLVPDSDLDLSLHLAHYVMPAPGSWQQVLQHARRHSLTDLDRDRALWRAVLFDGLAGGRSAVILVVHHAICDGQGLVKIIGGLLDPAREDAPDDVTKAPTRQQAGQPDLSPKSPSADHARTARAAPRAEPMSSRARRIVTSRSRAGGCCGSPARLARLGRCTPRHSRRC